MLDTLRRFMRRLRGLTRPDSVRAEIAEEMAYHLDMRTRDFVNSGLSAADARAMAERCFGPLDDHVDAGYRARGGSNILNQPSAITPIVMSLAALITVYVHVALYGGAREPDEGTAAHIWQVLMTLQLPVLLYFAVKWFPRSPGRAAFVMVLQGIAAVSALLPVFLLGL